MSDKIEQDWTRFMNRMERIGRNHRTEYQDLADQFHARDPYELEEREAYEDGKAEYDDEIRRSFDD